ncbi:hypothetical protein CYMTET_9091 [Cymbomonas tetramitiformis]|uniref:Cyclic nucleotide-binding domain-containing protein n=1 Tax=Cymbomonas tetramitiformis TaxID=36881 RepID=A0AAE0LFV1_9CHLO|nr:hypothetical protein CYMTET_9091 [Cymbomonas tetramitiformis]
MTHAQKMGKNLFQKAAAKAAQSQKKGYQQQRRNIDLAMWKYKAKELLPGETPEGLKNRIGHSVATVDELGEFQSWSTHWRGFTHAELETLSKFCLKVNMDAGDMLMIKGELATFFMFVLDGSVEWEGLQGQRHTVQRGGIVGEFTIFDRAGRASNVYVGELGCMALLLLHEQLAVLMKHHGRLGAKVVMALGYCMGSKLREERLRCEADAFDCTAGTLQDTEIGFAAKMQLFDAICAPRAGKRNSMESIGVELSSEDREALSAWLLIRRAPSGHQFQAEGTGGRTCLLVLDGSLRVHAGTASSSDFEIGCGGLTGTEVMLNSVDPRSGEYAYTVRAAGEVSVAMVSYDDVVELSLSGVPYLWIGVRLMLFILFPSTGLTQSMFTFAPDRAPSSAVASPPVPSSASQQRDVEENDFTPELALQLLTMCQSTSPWFFGFSLEELELLSTLVTCQHHSKGCPINMDHPAGYVALLAQGALHIHHQEPVPPEELKENDNPDEPLMREVQLEVIAGDFLGLAFQPALAKEGARVESAGYYTVLIFLPMEHVVQRLQAQDPPPDEAVLKAHQQLFFHWVLCAERAAVFGSRRRRFETSRVQLPAAFTTFEKLYEKLEEGLQQAKNIKTGNINIGLGRHMEEGDLTAFVSAMYMHRVKAGKQVLSSQSMAEHMAIVINGTLEVRRLDDPTRIERWEAAGSCLGAQTFLRSVRIPSQHTEDVYATVDSELAVLPYSAIPAVLEDYPKQSERFLRHMMEMAISKETAKMSRIEKKKMNITFLLGGKLTQIQSGKEPVFEELIQYMLSNKPTKKGTKRRSLSQIIARSKNTVLSEDPKKDPWAIALLPKAVLDAVKRKEHLDAIARRRREMEEKKKLEEHQAKRAMMRERMKEASAKAAKVTKKVAMRLQKVVRRSVFLLKTQAEPQAGPQPADPDGAVADASTTRTSRRRSRHPSLAGGRKSVIAGGRKSVIAGGRKSVVTAGQQNIIQESSEEVRAQQPSHGPGAQQQQPSQGPEAQQQQQPSQGPEAQQQQQPSQGPEAQQQQQQPSQGPEAQQQQPSQGPEAQQQPLASRATQQPQGQSAKEGGGARAEPPESMLAAQTRKAEETVQRVTFMEPSEASSLGFPSNSNSAVEVARSAADMAVMTDMTCLEECDMDDLLEDVSERDLQEESLSNGSDDDLEEGADTSGEDDTDSEDLDMEDEDEARLSAALLDVDMSGMLGEMEEQKLSRPARISRLSRDTNEDHALEEEMREIAGLGAERGKQRFAKLIARVKVCNRFVRASLPAPRQEALLVDDLYHNSKEIETFMPPEILKELTQELSERQPDAIDNHDIALRYRRASRLETDLDVNFGSDIMRAYHDEEDSFLRRGKNQDVSFLSYSESEQATRTEVAGSNSTLAAAKDEDVCSELGEEDEQELEDIITEDIYNDALAQLNARKQATAQAAPQEDADMIALRETRIEQEGSMSGSLPGKREARRSNRLSSDARNVARSRRASRSMERWSSRKARLLHEAVHSRHSHQRPQPSSGGALARSTSLNRVPKQVGVRLALRKVHKDAGLVTTAAESMEISARSVIVKAPTTSKAPPTEKPSQRPEEHVEKSLKHLKAPSKKASMAERQPAHSAKAVMPYEGTLMTLRMAREEPAESLDGSQPFHSYRPRSPGGAEVGESASPTTNSKLGSFKRRDVTTKQVADWAKLSDRPSSEVKLRLAAAGSSPRKAPEDSRPAFAKGMTPREDSLMIAPKLESPEPRVVGSFGPNDNPYEPGADRRGGNTAEADGSLRPYSPSAEPHTPAAEGRHDDVDGIIRREAHAYEAANEGAEALRPYLAYDSDVYAAEDRQRAQWSEMEEFGSSGYSHKVHGHSSGFRGHRTEPAHGQLPQHAGRTHTYLLGRKYQMRRPAPLRPEGEYVHYLPRHAHNQEFFQPHPYLPHDLYPHLQQERPRTQEHARHPMDLETERIRSKTPDGMSTRDLGMTSSMVPHGGSLPFPGLWSEMVKISSSDNSPYAPPAERSPWRQRPHWQPRQMDMKVPKVGSYVRGAARPARTPPKPGGGHQPLQVAPESRRYQEKNSKKRLILPELRPAVSNKEFVQSYVQERSHDNLPLSLLVQQNLHKSQS